MHHNDFYQNFRFRDIHHPVVARYRWWNEITKVAMLWTRWETMIYISSIWLQKSKALFP